MAASEGRSKPDSSAKMAEDQENIRVAARRAATVEPDLMPERDSEPGSEHKFGRPMRSRNSLVSYPDSDDEEDEDLQAALAQSLKEAKA